MKRQDRHVNSEGGPQQAGSRQHDGGQGTLGSQQAPSQTQNEALVEEALQRSVSAALMGSGISQVRPCARPTDQDLYDSYRRFWGELRPRQRVVISMLFERGMSQKAIARELDCSEGNVSDLVSRATKNRDQALMRERIELLKLLREEEARREREDT